MYVEGSYSQIIPRVLLFLARLRIRIRIKVMLIRSPDFWAIPEPDLRSLILIRYIRLRTYLDLCAPGTIVLNWDVEISVVHI